MSCLVHSTDDVANEYKYIVQHVMNKKTIFTTEMSNAINSLIMQMEFNFNKWVNSSALTVTKHDQYWEEKYNN